VTTHQSDTIR